MNLNRVLTLIASAVVIVLTGTGSVASAITCTSDRYLAYGVDTDSIGPALGAYNDPSFTPAACRTKKYHVNFGSTAVGQLRNYGTASGYWTCQYMRVMVVNGSFQTGLNVRTDAGELKQSLIGGSVLYVVYEMYSDYGVTHWNASWANTNACSVANP